MDGDADVKRRPNLLARKVCWPANVTVDLVSDEAPAAAVPAE
jgi:hypothetical protein